MTRLIIFAPNWLGDAVMALPAIADVRRGSPGATLVVAARPSVAPLFEMVPDVDEVVADRGGKPLTHSRNPALAGDTAILLPNSFRSALVARRAGIPERWGYRTDWRGLLLTRAVARPPAGIHQIEYYQRLAHALGFPNGPGTPRLEAPSTARVVAACTLERAGWDGRTPLIAIAPGAAYGGSRRWPADRFAALVRALAGDGMRPILIGSAADVATGRSIESSLGDSTTVLNLIGRTDLPALAGVLACARGLVSNDSGAMHLGAALGVPVTAILGPTDERVTGPRADSQLPAHSPEPPASNLQPRATVLSQKVWCSPCTFRECPIDHRCMRRISVDVVLDATRRML